ncbi:Copine family protein 1 [Caenorhabditis elegans]|uniref:Isoform a of Copine family protein 1 n=1 Tax=Caenorhabditis elegans TaxID=6239 RepID=H2KYS8-2|nr:Copine family protein 1 [Caenorhabditis elegans]CCD64642.1 Copine family protein 1 [Caenorhabditis elegans]|eukprot:NP_494737.1 Copine family protein 1 [Caenorhabditis elegans]
MVFDARLGYDPDEWEECPEPEHFLVFSGFTRYMLTFAAIAFVYYFFKLLDDKNKKESGEKEEPQTSVESVLAKAGDKLHDVKEQVQQHIPESAEELMREADQYLKEQAHSVQNNVHQFAEQAANKFPSLEVDLNLGHPIDATREKFDTVLSSVNNHLHETKNMDLSPTSRDSTQFEQIPSIAPEESAFGHDFEHVPPHLKTAAEQYYAQQHQPPPVPQHKIVQPVPISPTDQQLLHEFDIYDAPAHQRMNQISEQLGQLGQKTPAQLQQLQHAQLAHQQLQQQGVFQPIQQPSPLQIQTHPQQPYFDFSQLSPASQARYNQQQFVDISQLSPGAGALIAEQQASGAFQPVTKKLGREKRLSEQDERALQDWEKEKALLEADRLKKLLDHEVGGDSTDLDSSQKAYDHFAPASHISYESHSGAAQIQPMTPTAPKRADVPAPQVTSITNVRDSQLTDYDISDFHAHDEPHYHTVLTPQQLQQNQQQHQQPSAIDRRRTTADSDDYVKVSEPIYDYPPKGHEAPVAEPKRISPTEAAQLQELYQEYDLGLDLPGVAPIQGVAKPPVQQRTPLQIQQQVVQNVQNQPNMMARQNSVPESPRTVINVPISRKTDVPIQVQQQQNQFSYNVPIQVKDDPRNLATADLFVQDAQEYVAHQQNQQDKGSFVMEEEMLSLHEPETGSNKKKLTPKNPSFEATSRQVRTNDVFERIEHDEHDDMTYAPEIQSVEIPPDQMSETSENMIDYFDKVAAESEQQIQHLQEQQNTLKKQQAPQILPAFGNRISSNSSLGSAGRSGSGVSSSDVYPYRHLRKQSSLLSVLGVTSMQEMLLAITSLDSLSEAMRKAGLETTNLIFGIDYTASNKYQGEESFGGRSLHTIHPHVTNPYQQVISILGRTLAPFAGQGRLGVYGFGDAKTGDWSVFNLKGEGGDCRSLDEVLNVYNTVTPTVALSGPTNFAPLIYQAMEICQKSRDYHILVIIADGQVTNERATRRAIVQACQHPLSIIVVGVGDGPWDMMRIFDESLPKRPWDNFHFVEFHEIVKKSTNMEDGDVKLAVQSLLEIPDQYRCICELGLLDRSIPPRGSEIRREMMHNPL